MSDLLNRGKQQSDLDPVFLLPRPKIWRRTMNKSSPQIPAGDELPTEADAESTIQCINCLDIVSGEVIDMHRTVCSTFVEINISAEGALQSNQSQVLKFSRYIEQLLKNPCIESSDTHLLKILQKNSNQLKEKETNYSDSVQLHESVKVLWDTYKGKTNLRIIIERLLSLIKTQISIFQCTVVKERKNKITNMKSQLIRLRKNIAMNSSRNEIKINKAKIDEITSQIRSKKNSSGKFSESEATFEKKSTQNFDKEANENFQQHFYGICLQIKMQIESSSPAQAVPISFLYHKATKEKVRPEDWPQYIKKQLTNPANWKGGPARKPPVIKLNNNRFY